MPLHTLLEEKGLRLSGLVLKVMSDLHLSLDLRNPLLDTVCTHVVLVVLIQRKAAECAITQQRLQQTMCSSLYILLMQCSINMQQRLHNNTLYIQSVCFMPHTLCSYVSGQPV